MDFRGRAQRDGRRRRVLLEENKEEAAPATLEMKPRRGKCPYPPDALTKSQPRVTDAIPEKNKSIWITSLVFAAAIALVVFLESKRTQWAAALPALPTQLFEAAAPGSLAALLNGVQFLSAACAVGLIWSITRRRLDDYRGRYRHWILASLALVALGLESFTRARFLIAFGITAIPGVPKIASPEIVWSLLSLLTFAPITIRVLWAVRRHPKTQFAIAVAGLLSSAAPYCNTLPLSAETARILSAALTLGSGYFAAIGCWLHARTIRRQAASAIRGKKPKAEAAEAKGEGENEDSAEEKVVARKLTEEATKNKPNRPGDSSRRSSNEDDEEEADRRNRNDRNRQQRRAA